MIGRLRGQLALRGEDHVMLDVGGVGYIVYVSDRTMAALPDLGEATELFTELVVREDLMQLFGFPTMLEKEWHKLLTSVQGIGAKGAMAILGTLGADGVGRAIAMGDWAAVKAAPGVGPKIAQRLVNELKNKAPSVMMGGTAALQSGASDIPVIDAGDSGAQADAISALTNLGYAPADAARAVAEAQSETPDAGSASLIKDALRKLAPAG